MHPVRASLLAVFCLGLAASASAQNTKEDRLAVLKTLHWTQGANATLTDAEAKLTLPSNYTTLDQADARTFMKTTSVIGDLDPIDALVADPASEDIVLLEHVREGYVKTDDWSKVDSDAMLRQMIDNTEDSNEERQEKGLPPAHITGWVQRPAFDPATKTVQWAIAANIGDHKVVNASELIFGRRGYEKLTWAGDADHSPTTFLSDVRKGFTFNAGSTYGDYKEGDKVAAYGLAALIATAVGAKVAAHFGLFAGLLILAKKGIALIVVGIAVLRRKIRNLFSGKKKQPDVMTSNGGEPPP